MANEVTPLYRPGNDVTCVVDGAPIKGGTFVDIAGNLKGSLPTVKTATAAGPSFGVAATDSDSHTKRVPVIRGSKVILPVTAGGAITAGDMIEVGANGTAAKKAAGVSVGRAVSTAANGALVYVELY